MLPPLYAVLMDSTAVTNIIGNRCYPFGEAIQDTDKPYVVWQIIGGSAENNISTSADIDQLVIQVDCYHQSPVGIEALADAVRTAIETIGHITGYPVNEREPDTKLYRIALQLDWWYTR
jgi:hypothetical protein